MSDQSLTLAKEQSVTRDKVVHISKHHARGAFATGPSVVLNCTGSDGSSSIVLSSLHSSERSSISYGVSSSRSYSGESIPQSEYTEISVNDSEEEGHSVGYESDSQTSRNHTNDVFDDVSPESSVVDGTNSDHSEDGILSRNGYDSNCDGEEDSRRQYA